MPGSSTPQSRLPVLHRRSSDDRNPDDNVVDPSWQAQLPARVLDEIDVGVLLCDIHRRVRMSNWTAQRELECARLLRIGCGLLCSSVNECGLSEAIAVACTRGRRQIVALGRGDERLYVSVSPLPDLTGNTLALLVLGRRECASRHGLELLGIQQGLTPAERRVLVGLAAQRSPAQISSDHGVELSTVRTQIGALRSKLDARSLHALICLVGAVPPLAMALRLASHADAGPHGHFSEGMAAAA